MNVDVISRELIPTHLVAEAARESSRRALGQIRPHVKDVRVTVTDRRLKLGMACCQVEIDLAGGGAVAARSVNTNPVEAVAQAFDKVARRIHRQLRQERLRPRTPPNRQAYALRKHGAKANVASYQTVPNRSNLNKVTPTVVL